MGVSGQRHAQAALYPRGKDPRDRRLGGPQSRSGRRGQKKNPLPLSGIELRSLDRLARSQTLYCLSYRGSILRTVHGIFYVYSKTVVLNLSCLGLHFRSEIPKDHQLTTNFYLVS
jgi:hypothetical protein